MTQRRKSASLRPTLTVLRRPPRRRFFGDSACEKYQLDACDRVAHRCALLSLGRQVARADTASCGDHHRTGDCRHHGADQSVEQPLLQRAAGAQLGQLRLRTRLFLGACSDLYRACGLSTLPEPVAADPLAQMADAALSRRLAAGRQPLPHAAHWATPRTTRTSASPKTSSSSSSEPCRSASAC